MSRSFKKTPGYSDFSRSHTPFAKRLSNKLVRRHPNLADGGQYKHVMCSYDIRDYNSRWYTKQEYERFCEKWGFPPHKFRMK